MSVLNLIIIGGELRTGKDSLAIHICGLKSNSYIIRIADYIRDLVSDIFDVDREFLTSKKDSYLPDRNITGRQLLQKTGDFLRSIDEMFIIRKTKEKINEIYEKNSSKGDVTVIITDQRFYKELISLTNFPMENRVFKIKMKREKNKDSSIKKSNHISEIQVRLISDSEYDYIVSDMNKPDDISFCDFLSIEASKILERLDSIKPTVPSKDWR